MNKSEVLEEREALIEMYKAGFLDGYSINNPIKSKKSHDLMNVKYKESFIKRFESKINKALKK